jgi:hypothetical protein
MGSPSRFGRTASLVVLMALLAGGCSGSGPAAEGDRGTPTSSEPSAAQQPNTGYPDSIAAVGHSGITGESSHEQRFEGSMEDAWPTGTNPEVDSVYARILARNPAIAGNVTNLGMPNATIADVQDQVDQLLEVDPAPELVLVQVVDADMACPATEDDFRGFEAELTALLQRIADELPAARVYMTSYYADPASYVAALNHSERQQVGSTGPCAIINPTGQVVAAELARLKGIVAGYNEAIESACATADRCTYDDGAFTRVRLQRQDIGGDLEHISTVGHAEAAATAWRAMRIAGLIPAER